MEINRIGKPENMELPFFAYGIFKPGQIAYYSIKNYIQGNPIESNVHHEMKYRDGIPILCGEKNDVYRTKGYLIKFHNPERAYNRIGKAQVEELYQWKKIDVGGVEANALVGKDMQKGCLDNSQRVLSDYDYRNDSFFVDARNLIRDCVDEYREIDELNMEDFFNLQMHHMLLWSIIERFCIFKYGYFGMGSNKFNLAREPMFKNNLKHVGREDTIYSSDKLERYSLDPNDYRESIGYYYTIRCNVIHKGKTVGDDERIKLKKSLEELFALFESVYKDTLNRNDQELSRLNNY